ncbi:amino acid ABC transporter substrate-binding protein [Acidovorax sp. Root267]|uniref:ABC transporter substrate-binding protein n=1 Tax=Acidovorax sp. Root267 TaxID=1736505 RepID=UPI00070A803B|nr:ABC transporter substrate-binding protein [Acidovorax sp. Root267]KRD26551.1 amino acid ABC transporter substrate-binding protein [Acidovorax sp. Root267]
MKIFVRTLAAIGVAVLCSTGQAQILIGQSVGLTGSAAATVAESMQGVALYLDHINAKGGVAGQKVEIVSLDDKFDPKLTLENTRTLIEDKGVIGMFMTRGTPHTQGIMPMLEQRGVPLVGPSTGATVLHQPVHKYVFNVRAPYQREVEKAITHLHTLGIKRIGVVHVDDTFGADGLAGAQQGFKANQLEALFIEKFDRAKPDYSAIAPRVAQKQPQAVIFIGTGAAVVDGIKALRAASFKGQIVTLSNNASEGFIKALGEQARGVVVTQVFPSERWLNYAVIKEAMDLVRAKRLSALTPAMVEGFVSAKVLVEGLKRAGPKPNRAKLHAGLESIHNWDLGGLELSYSPTDHSGLGFTELAIIGENGHFQR